MRADHFGFPTCTSLFPISPNLCQDPRVPFLPPLGSSFRIRSLDHHQSSYHEHGPPSPSTLPYDPDSESVFSLHNVLKCPLIIKRHTGHSNCPLLNVSRTLTLDQLISFSGRCANNHSRRCQRFRTLLLATALIALQDNVKIMQRKEFQIPHRIKLTIFASFAHSFSAILLPE